MLAFVGAPPAPEKCIPPAAVRTFLGASVDVSPVHSEGIVGFAPKVTSVEKVQIMIQSALHTQQLTPGNASNLRCGLEWATRHSFGKVATIGNRALKSSQYDCADTHALSRDLESALIHILAVLSVVLCMSIQCQNNFALCVAMLQLNLTQCHDWDGYAFMNADTLHWVVHWISIRTQSRHGCHAKHKFLLLKHFAFPRQYWTANSLCRSRHHLVCR